MVIIERALTQIAVLDVVGPMTVQNGTHTLAWQVQRCLDAGQRYVLLNLREVPDCDTGAIGSLVTCLTHVQGRAGRLVLVGPPPCLCELLQTMGLLADFDIAADELTALSGLGRAAE